MIQCFVMDVKIDLTYGRLWLKTTLKNINMVRAGRDNSPVELGASPTRCSRTLAQVDKAISGYGKLGHTVMMLHRVTTH